MKFIAENQSKRAQMAQMVPDRARWGQMAADMALDASDGCQGAFGGSLISAFEVRRRNGCLPASGCSFLQLLLVAKLLSGNIWRFISLHFWVLVTKWLSRVFWELTESIGTLGTPRSLMVRP